MDAGQTEKELVITRTFDAPRERIWKAWTEPNEMKRWWGPKDFSAPSIMMDFRVDGKYLYCMRSAEGEDFWSTGKYKEIIPMEKIVSTDNFADAKGNIVSAASLGLPGNWSKELLITITFEDAGNDKTKMTLHHDGLPSGQMRKMTEAGWNQSLDKLAKSLQ